MAGRSTDLQRRTVLTAALTGAAVGLGFRGDTAHDPTSLAHLPNATIERVHSTARGRDVELVTVFPNGLRREGLPVCLMLHGRFGSARRSVSALPHQISAAVQQRQVPPFAYVAVDGGDNTYWHEHAADDPMGMLLNEVPDWLRERELGDAHGQPFAASGISMGGFGALLYARRRNERNSPLNATSVISPALMTWREMRKRNAFASADSWKRRDPLRNVDALGDVPLGVWCGTQDRFIHGTRQLIATAQPEVSSTTPGTHGPSYYRKAIPPAVRFIGNHADDTRIRT